MNAHDPYEAFEAITRHQAETVATPSRLRAAITSEHQPGPPRSRRKRVVIGLVATTTLAIAAGTAVARYLDDTPPEVGAACHSAPDVNSPAIVLAPDVDPLAGCAELWANGQLPDPQQPHESPQPVPELVVCAEPGRANRVFPGTPGQCEVLGLNPADLTPTPDRDAITELVNEVSETINGAECDTATNVEPAIRDILEQHQLHNWTIEPTPPAKTAPCVKAEVDSPNQRILLHPF